MLHTDLCSTRRAGLMSSISSAPEPSAHPANAVGEDMLAHTEKHEDLDPGQDAATPLVDVGAHLAQVPINVAHGSGSGITVERSSASTVHG